MAQRYLAAGDQSLLLLDEALALLVNRTALDLELKPAPPGVSPGDLAQLLLQALVRAGSPQNVVATSSDPQVLQALKRRAPRLAVGLVWQSDDPRAPITLLRECGGELLVANHRRLSESLVREARAAGLIVWGYTVNDVDLAQQLRGWGIDAIITDDEPRLRCEIDGVDEGVAIDEPAILALDLGSSVTKAALVSPQRGVLTRAGLATPLTRGVDGTLEHDPDECVAVARQVVETVLSRATAPVPALGIATQRSSGLWLDRPNGTPVTAALSWRDPRQADLTVLEAQRESLEREAGLPLAPAWTALKGRVLRPQPRAGEQLVPLGAYVAARLCGEPVRVDATLANRMFLLGSETLRYSPQLLAAFQLSEEQLPPLVPSVFDHGLLAQAAGDPIRWTALLGDQPAAYIGAAGPLERRLVINLGTAAFVMRVEARRRPVESVLRVGPLWTSRANPTPSARLVEYPLVAHPLVDDAAIEADAAARRIARLVALGDPAPQQFLDQLVTAVQRLVLPQDQSVTIAGAPLGSPHLVTLLAAALPLTAVFCEQVEVTLLGAARMAAAGARVGWSLPHGGGARPRLWV